jgi:4,5-DOPA dioxygenase extradiol
MPDSTPALMPAAFIGHGSPMNALEVNTYTAAWRDFGQAVPRPRAILVISAHWYINATAVTTMALPRTIHDFYGFPQQLFDVQYPAPGSPDLVDEIREIVKPTWIGADIDSWGIDHGAWSVLIHAFPDASIPVVQMSINADKPMGYHLDLGAQLSVLRQRGVLIIGSGNIVHNLALTRGDAGTSGFDWATRFDNAATEILTTDPYELLRLTSHPDYPAAAPTPDHFIPMVYIAGSAGAAKTVLDQQVRGFCAGSLSMASYTLGVDTEIDTTNEAPPSGLRLYAPADQSNT